MNFSRLIAMLFFALCAMTSQAQVKLDFDFNNRGQMITEDHYGIFFEEINHAGDGGLYAELVRNRSFEEDMNSPICWSTSGNATISLTSDNMMNEVQQRALKVDINRAGAGVKNEGYWGINIVQGRKYNLSFWIRADQEYNGTITAELQNGGALRLGQATVNVNATQEWKNYTAEITATGNEARGYLVLKGSAKGTIYLDVVSLFPPTFKNRPNGCREDLAQMLADLKPSFMRFPGGCYIEGFYGDGSTNRFEWKKSVGPIEMRPGHLNRNWGYKVTDGMGYHECLQLAEDLGASSMFVVNMGIGHEWRVDDNKLDPFIQEALDAIEYAKGSTDTFYGKMRAENGHPEPFDLKYLEVGNEQEFMLNRDDYMKRYMQFYNAIKTRWPDIHIIADSYYFDNITEPVELKDEHYYDTPDFFVSQYGRWDNHSKSSTHVYVGEYAVTKDCGWWGNLNAAIGEAVFMEGTENNGEAVTMMSYAPIFTHEENYVWHPDMIRFNSSLSYGTPSYYVQRMFSNNVGKQNIRWNETDNKPSFDTQNGSIGIGTWVTSATFTDLSVTAGNVKISGADYAQDQWTTKNGTWSISEGSFKQTNTSDAEVTCVLNQVFNTTNVDMTVHATKNGGSEGFLIIFDYKDAQNYSWLNLGGWGNSKHAVEQCKNGAKTVLADKTGKLTTGKEYTIRVLKEGQHVRCYIDGELIIDTYLKEYANRLVYTSANIDDENGILYVKLVNPSNQSTPVTLSFNNGRVTSGSAEVLNSANGTDENTVNSPSYIKPRNRTVTVNSDGTITFNVLAYSVNVLKLNVADVGVPVADPIPEPTLSYSFDEGTPVDDSGNYVGTLYGKATIEQQSDGNYVLSTGQLGEKSYMGIPIGAVRNALQGATDYTVSLNVLQRIGNNTGQFSWALELSNSTNIYYGIINSGGNSNWYCEIKDNNNNCNIPSYSCLRIGEWHNITCTQKDGRVRLYVDGQLRQEQNATVKLPDLVGRLRTAYIGHSPFGGDAIMEHALFDDFKIYNTALTELQVKNIANNAIAMHDDGQYEGIADFQDFEILVNEVKNWYQDAGNESLTKAFNNASQALKNGTNKVKQQRYLELKNRVNEYQQEQLQLASTKQPANLTFLITNSSFTRYNVGWQGVHVPSVNGTSFGGYTNETTEMFSRQFDVWQELTNIPAGAYMLKANAFYRAGAIETAYAAWQQKDASINNAQLYIGDSYSTIQNLYSCQDYTYNPYNYPDNLTAASTAFNTNGQYADNSVVFVLEDEGQPLRLGIRKQQTVAADWVAYDHFQLFYLGDATSIENIANDRINTSSDVYDLQGRKIGNMNPSEIHNLHKGVYIVGERKVIVH